MHIKIAHISDSHISVDYSDDLINELFTKTKTSPVDNLIFTLKYIEENYKDLDFYIFTGDLSHKGDLESYQLLRNIIDKYTNKEIYYCLGNHDKIENFTAVFSNERIINSKYIYEKNIKNSNFDIISLDSSKSEIGLFEIDKFQLDFLENSSKKEKLLLIHNPPYLGDDIYSLSYQVKNSDKLFEIIKKLNIRAIFSGHIHRNISYLLSDKTPVFIADSLAFNLKYDKTQVKASNICGFSIIDINKNNILKNDVQIPIPKIFTVEKKYSELYKF